MPHVACVWLCEDMIDHRSYANKLSSCEIKAWKKRKKKKKKIRPERDFSGFNSTAA